MGKQEMSFLKHLVGDVTLFSEIIVQYSAYFSEVLSYTACRQLSQMFLAIIFFHSSEYVLAIAIHGKSNVNLKSLLISKNYLLAMVFSLLEYSIEILLFMGLKEYWFISNLGLAMVVIGEIIRKMAIITAGEAFTHLIRTHPEEHHRLITHGIYRFVRHPGYSGFLIWSVGTQIMLCNPISTVLFAIVVWHFFAKRIPYEEYFLRQFFGFQYQEYAQRVLSGVPFVK
ncbi:Protein-S-isoprenylcysteine O-methyltransferase [Quillaja saponaria]|uniref:Protein-S-isoprenylcysteine O-methyltransferase n=1 Tax=Quillaja saponaria TaxID=32244 RepID=A0AAD7PFH8_QUISA|nr:Protein-S-isoprenylcysteine O-methyltransferase [Quillaja saponaria]